ncbi:MAG: hydantoinase B/oxoprolinase family protein, partial [Caulobacteraceae bacterium]|nr:hydantoinase B/oxoprolinase family protein [Caulobacter sp.]
RAAAIVFLHAHRFPEHERRAAAIARAAGFAQVSASHDVAPLIKLVSRGDTTVVDAYLSPVLGRHIERVRAELADTPGAEEARVLFMQSSGGLAEAHAFRGKDAVLSGPAGGLVALAAAAREAGFAHVVGFDMGGTSTDVSHYAGAFERTDETEVAGVRLRAPMLAVHTVAAGGGSVCRFEDGRLRVGPQSAGADPGPAAYRRGGPLTVTDCNVLLGRIRPDRFPAVFGPEGDQPLDLAAVHARFAETAQAVRAATGQAHAPEALAEGFLQVAVELTARAIRRVSTERGHDLAGYALMSFGGAGGQHCCRVAEALGVRTVLLHPLAGVLSAWGMGLAPLQASRSRTVSAPLAPGRWAEVEGALAALEADARAVLRAQGAADAEVSVETRLSVRYAGVDAALELAAAPPEALADAFEREHRSRFGFATPGREVIVEAATVEATAAASPPSLGQPRRRSPVGEDLARDHGHAAEVDGPAAPTPLEVVDAGFTGGRRSAPLYARDDLRSGAAFEGPAIVQEATGTVVVEPGWRARTDLHGALILERTGAATPVGALDAAVDPLQLELFASRFMAAAEEMGSALQATASSVNIKERLDFSCAVFDAAGALIANAPHIPVHLGSMGESVKAVMAARAGDGRGVRPGDAYMHNAPYSGGTHLPDITVITPVF